MLFLLNKCSYSGGKRGWAGRGPRRDLLPPLHRVPHQGYAAVKGQSTFVFTRCAKQRVDALKASEMFHGEFKT